MKKIYNDKFYLGVQDILANEAFGNEYLKYVESRLINPEAVWENMRNEDLFQEFVAKCQFVQHRAKTKLGADISMELAANGINKENANSFSNAICGDLFNGFMHFISVNEKKPCCFKVFDGYLVVAR